MSDDISKFCVDLITYPYNNLDAGLAIFYQKKMAQMFHLVSAITSQSM